MDHAFHPDNPIAFAQFRLRGGWRNMAWTAGGYAVLIFALMSGSIWMTSLGFRATYNSWATILLGLQLAILLFFGSSNVTSAIRNDRTNGMIESHRLMPTGSAAALLGYLLGAPCQAIALVAANFLLGIFAIAQAGLPLELWLAANAVLVWFSLCLWSVMAVLAFGAKGGALLIYLPIASLWFSQGMSIQLLPGFAVVASPMSGNSIFAWTLSARSAPYPFVVGAMAQGYFAAICFAGACRKYRRPEAPAFSPILGLLLLAGWVAVSLVGIDQWEQFRPRFISGRVEHTTQLVATMTVSMLLALLPIGASVAAETDWRRRLWFNDSERGPRPLPMPLVATTAAALVLALLVAGKSPASGRMDRIVWLAAAILAALLCPAFLMRLCLHRGIRGVFVVSTWLVLTWGVTVLGELLVRTLWIDSQPQGEFPGPIACVSPPVAMNQLLQQDSQPAKGGILLHAAAAVLLGFLFYSTARRDRRSLIRRRANGGLLSAELKA